MTQMWPPCAIRLAVLVLAAPAACHAFVVPPVSGRGGVATGATVWGAKGGARLSSPGLLGLRAGGEKLPSSAQEAPVELDGRVLHPGSEGSGWWDARTTAMAKTHRMGLPKVGAVVLDHALPQLAKR